MGTRLLEAGSVVVVADVVVDGLVVDGLVVDGLVVADRQSNKTATATAIAAAVTQF